MFVVVASNAEATTQTSGLLMAGGCYSNMKEFLFF
jgi:hypothetical protein